MKTYILAFFGIPACAWLTGIVCALIYNLFTHGWNFVLNTPIFVP